MQQGAGSAAFSAPGDLALTRGGSLRPLRRIEMLAHLSGAFDLAEEQPAGHAARVAYLAHEIARRLDYSPEARRRILAIGLLHDAGAAVRHDQGHLEAGVWVAERFGFDAAVAEGIRASRERWDGRGRPHGRAGANAPVDGLVVHAAHWACEFADSAMSPLRARAQLQNSSIQDIEPLAGPAIAAALREVLHEDATWLALWDDDVTRHVAQSGIGEGRPSYRHLLDGATAMGDVLDAAVREPGRARRVAGLARQLALTIGLSEGYCEAIGVAGHLLDLGYLGVPRHVTDKPSILTVDEMELVRCHPGVGARLLGRVPGLHEVSEWVLAHHERPDGRGYPEMLTAESLSLPPRILAIADAYWALRAERPYRPAFSEEEAMVMIELGAGRQFDQHVVDALPDALDAFDEAAECPPVPGEGDGADAAG